MDYTKGTKVRHKTKGMVETIVSLCKVKVNGVWMDGLIAGMKYGIDHPAIDNCISIYDKKGNRLGEYL